MSHLAPPKPASQTSAPSPVRQSRVAAYLLLMRPMDWSKNVLVLAALVFSQNLLHADKWLAALLAFAAFCLLASGFYAFNDALDAASDRRHPMKRHRPVAAGIIPPRRAMAFGVGCILAGLAIGFAINLLAGAIGLAYIGLQIAYNVRLKRVMMVDVVALSLGFVLRAAVGAAAIAVPLSIWLVMCVFFLCLYLGLAKRLADLTSAQQDAEADGWQPSANYDRSPELTWLLGISATLAIATYLMYTLSPHAAEQFGPRAMGLALLTPLVVIAIYRFYRRALLGRSDRPVDALFDDPGVRLASILFALGTIMSLYLPRAGEWLDRLFLR